MYKKSFTELIHPDDREQYVAKLKKFIKGETLQYDTKERYIRKDGGVIGVQIAIKLIKDSQGKPIRAIGIISTNK